MARNSEDAFFCVGISHKTAPVEIRERVSFDNGQTGEILTRIRGIEGVSECVVLSTCNRTEIYGVSVGESGAAVVRVGEWLLDASGAEDTVREHLYFLEGLAAIRHLFRVASGLDSMIPGEPQILGQVKAAYASACDYRTTGPAVNRLFHHAFKAGKSVRSNTSIGEGAVSASYASVELAKRVFGNLAGRTAVLIGAGKIGEICARRLADSGVKKLFIVNRTFERALDLADRLFGEAIPFERLYEICADADIVIASATTREPIIRKDAILPLLTRRSDSPIFLFDLGVPRNIEPFPAECGSVHLYDIDDLEEVILDNRDRRDVEAERAGELIDRMVAEFLSRLAVHEVAPVIRDLHDRCEIVRLSELERVRNRVDEETLELLDLVTRRIVRKLLHNPTVAVRSSESGATRERLLRSVRELFLEQAAFPEDAELESADEQG